MKTILMFLIVCPLIIGQPQPVTNTFKISGDNPSGNFLQKSPDLFFNDTSNFVITWDDYRTGPLTYMGININSNGVPTSNNFSLKGREDFSFFNSDKFLTISNRVYGYYDISYIDYLGHIQTSGNIIYSGIQLGTATVPWCGTGWLGISHSLMKKNNNFYFYLNNGGNIHHVIFDSSGNTINSTYDSLFNADEQAVTSTDDNYSALFWFAVDFYNGSIEKVFGRFFDPQDNVIGDSILIYQTDSSFYFFPGSDNFLNSTVTQDNNYLLYFILSDTLYYSLLSKQGNILNPLKKIALKHFGSVNDIILYNFSVSSFSNGAFDLFITLRNRVNNVPKYFSTIHSFSSSGNYLGEIAGNTVFSERLPEKLFKKGDQAYFIPIEHNSDIYLASFNNFIITPLNKVTDDLAGSNEISSNVIIKDNSTSLISWNDGNNFKGRLVQTDGALLGSEVILPSTDIRFLADGSAIAFQKTSDMLVIYKLNSSLQILQSDTLKIADQIITGILNYYAYVADENKLILLIAKYDSAFLLSIDFNLNIIKKKDLTHGNNGSGLAIYKRSANEFYIKMSNRIQLFDTQLNELSNHKLLSVSEYLGDDKFLFVYTISPNTASEYGFFADIIHFDSTIIKKKLKLFDWGYNFQFNSIYDGVFAVTFTNNQGELKFKSFNSNGIQLMQEFKLEHLADLSYKDFSFKRWNEKIFFTWTDNRDGNYDIWGKSFNVSQLVGNLDNPQTLPNKFQLFQNYPNPFNPSTTISYELSDDNYVSLIVFDILGRRVATLINNEFKSAGKHEVEFNIKDGLRTMHRELSTNIYFYQLTAGDLTATKKFILLK